MTYTKPFQACISQAALCFEINEAKVKVVFDFTKKGEVILTAASELLRHGKPFPLKRYYILYAGIGAMLFSFFVHAERQALYKQYIENLLEKANTILS